ncbi:D-alanine--D-serine ligase VanG [Brevibacillus ruminantium]|uniref:D-alanine--D-alanine ligase n=1 Tax=Brevibacillus ruminantium TaxID=2950604 RepID=A0ABY4WEZ5_9BACL|nr:D-alanine--D-serine ligase VanG [Brevibacillus ruminantium]USG64562.1 D-alanine--D-serine ligase VanG [Brevibacillus ruminantium]
MKKKKIAILFGGCSTEYEVSLKSAYAVLQHLDHSRYECVCIGITRQGEWFQYSGDLDKIAADTWREDERCIPAILSPSRNVQGIMTFHPDRMETTRLDAAFPVLHGRNGEDGTIQGLLELAGVPVIGCGTLSSALCMDKEMAHKIVSLAGIKVPRSIVITGRQSEEEMQELTQALSYPLFVKPVRGGSSFGISKIHRQAELFQAAVNALEYDQSVIIEENIEGFEVGCAVLGNEELIIGEVDEIELMGGFFDYKEKYSLETSRIHMPARIDPEFAEQIKHTAARIYRALGCRSFARVDMFVTPDREIVFNEVNTIPGFTPHSRYPNMLRGVGLSFTEIIDKLIRTEIDQ